MTNPNSGASPVDLTTQVGLVRVLVGDTDPKDFDPPIEGQGEYSWFSDDEITAMLPVFSDDPRRVAIQVLSLVSISQALKLKKWSSDDLSVDGPAIASAIEKTIARLSAEVTADTENYFDIVDTNTGFDEFPEGATRPYPSWLPAQW